MAQMLPSTVVAQGGQAAAGHDSGRGTSTPTDTPRVCLRLRNLQRDPAQQAPIRRSLAQHQANRTTRRLHSNQLLGG